jgi:hypothetical protein
MPLTIPARFTTHGAPSPAQIAHSFLTAGWVSSRIVLVRFDHTASLFTCSFDDNSDNPPACDCSSNNKRASNPSCESGKRESDANNTKNSANETLNAISSDVIGSALSRLP